MNKIGFIGMGNMGYAMLNGMLNVFEPTKLVYTDVSLSRMQQVNEFTKVDYVDTNSECVTQAQILIFAIKPQYYDAVINEIKDIVNEKHIIISLAPNISIQDLKAKLGFDARIVRVMPNTPALIGQGITGVTYNKQCISENEQQIISDIFNSFGKMIIVDEKLMSAVVCASGSSPAYVYMFIEALADGVVKYGMPRELAYDFVANTVMGAAKMVLETKEHPGKLKDQVCSPGGTTIAAVAALEEHGFRNAIIKATDECFKKADNK